MKYVLTSKDGVFYKKCILPDTAEITAEQIGVDKKTFVDVNLPCELVAGEFVSVDSVPELETEYFEMLETETEPTTEEILDAMLGVTNNE